MKFKFNKNNKMLILTISAITALSLVGCEQVQSAIASKSAEIESIKSSQSYDPQTTYIESTSQSSSDTSLNVTISDSDDVVPEPTGFEDYIDETIPHGKVITEDDYKNAAAYNPYFFYNGIDNPLLLNSIREYYNDDSITIDDVNYLCHLDHQDSYKGYDGGFSGVIRGLEDGHGFDMSFIRYVMSRNNLRFWIDEIPYSLISNLYPEYYEIFNFSLNDVPFYDLLQGNDKVNRFREAFEYNESIENLLDYSECDDDLYTCITFDNIGIYNVERYRCIFNSYELVKLGRNNEGRVVMIPTEIQYNKFNRAFQKIPGCENIDILKVETRDDLIESLGLEKVEMYDKVYDHILELADEYRRENNIQPINDDSDSSRT